MGNESGIESPPSSSSNAGKSFIGCFVSLISKYGIRYEGILYHFNPQDSTIALQDVRSYGTEGRRKDGPQVPPSDKIYEYILFRGSDITDLHVKSLPASAKAEEQMYSDQAIIQSQYSRMPLSSSSLASIGSRNFTKSTQWLDTPAMTRRAFSVGMPSHQSMAQLSPLDSSAATQVADQTSFPPLMYWQGNRISSSSVHSLQQSSHLQPQSTMSPSLLQNQMHTPETPAPTTMAWTARAESGIPASSATTSLLVNLNPSSSHSSLRIPDSMDIPSLLSTKTPMPYSASLTSNLSNIASFSPALQDLNSFEGQTSVKIAPDMRPTLPGHSTSDRNISSPPLLTPDQFAQPRQHLFSATHNLTSDQKGSTGTVTSTSFRTSVFVPSQEPLLSLPTSMQKPQNSATQFTEEFDFAAMNEKFKKDRVWGSLGKVTENIEGAKDNFSHSLGDKESHGPIPNPQASIDFQQRPDFDYVVHDAGRGDHYQGS